MLVLYATSSIDLERHVERQNALYDLFDYHLSSGPTKRRTISRSVCCFSNSRVAGNIRSTRVFALNTRENDANTTRDSNLALGIHIILNASIALVARRIHIWQNNGQHELTKRRTTYVLALIACASVHQTTKYLAFSVLLFLSNPLARYCIREKRAHCCTRSAFSGGTKQKGERSYAPALLYIRCHCADVKTAQFFLG